MLVCITDQDVYEQISFKLDMLIITIKVNSFVPVSMSLNVIQDHSSMKYPKFLWWSVNIFKGDDSREL